MGCGIEPLTQDEINAAIQKPGCPRVTLRMECLECGYPYSEAMYPTNIVVPHRDF